jgi:hypothetical protein
VPQLRRYSLQQRHLDTEPRAERHRQARTWCTTALQALEDEQQGWRGHVAAIPQHRSGGLDHGGIESKGFAHR